MLPTCRQYSRWLGLAVLTCLLAGTIWLLVESDSGDNVAHEATVATNRSGTPSAPADDPGDDVIILSIAVAGLGTTLAVSAILAGMQAMHLGPCARPTAPLASPARNLPSRAGSITSLPYEYDGELAYAAPGAGMEGGARTPAGDSCIFEAGDSKPNNPNRHPMLPDAPWYRSPVGSVTMFAMMQHVARGNVGENPNPMAITPARPGAPTTTPSKSMAQAMLSLPAGGAVPATSPRQKKSGFAAYAASLAPNEAGRYDGPVVPPRGTESQML